MHEFIFVRGKGGYRYLLGIIFCAFTDELTIPMSIPDQKELFGFK